MADDDLKAQIQLHEGRRKYAYTDTTGNLTIGVGHNLTANGLPEQLIDLLLEYDISQAVADLENNLPWTSTLDSVRHRVLVDMTFNLGINRLRAFKSTLKFVKEGRYEEASRQMMKSLWAKQVKSRAVRLAEMMKTGKDYSI